MALEMLAMDNPKLRIRNSYVLLVPYLLPTLPTIPMKSHVAKNEMRSELLYLL